MKKRLFVLTLLLMALCSVAFAAGQELENGNGTWTWYNGLPVDVSPDGLRNDSRILQFRIPEDDWQGTSVGAPVWSITNHSAAAPYDFDYDVETWNGGRGIQLVPRWDCGQETVTGTYTYTIKATYNGNNYEGDATINFVKDNYPTGITMTVNEVDLDTNTVGAAISMKNGAFVLQEGKDYVFTTDYIGNYPAVSHDILYMNGSLYGVLEEHGRYNPEFQSSNGRSIWSNNQMVFTAKKAGKVSFTPTLSIGMSNLESQGTFSLAILDANGNLPALTPNLVNWNWVDYSAAAIDYPIYTDVPLGYGDATSNNHIWQGSEFANIYIENWQDLQSEYGGSASWNVVASPNDLDYRTQTGNNGNQIWVLLNSVPTKDYTVTVTCTWGGHSTSKTIHLKPMPLISMPAGLDNLPDEIETQVGQTLILEPQILPTGFTLPNYSQNYFVAHGLGTFAQQDWDQSVPTFAVNTAGTYTDEVGFSFGPLYVTKTVTFKVKDVNGNLPVTATLQIKIGQNERNVYVGMPEYSDRFDEEGVFGETSSAYVWFRGHADLEQAYPNDSPVWNVRRKDGKDINITGWHEGYYAPSDESYFHFVLDDSENDPGDIEYEVSCTWGPLTSTDTMTVHYIQCPTTLPTGNDFPGFVDNLTVGDQLNIAANALPSGWMLPNASTYVYAYGMDDFATEEWNSSTATNKVYTIDKAGIYSAQIDLRIDTIHLIKDTVFRIADANGNVPGLEPQITSACGLERNYWLVPGAVPGVDGFGKLLADDYLDILEVSNEKACRYALQGDPVWSVVATTDYVGIRTDADGRKELYLKKMPTSAQDMTFDIACVWDGQTSAATYTLHFRETPNGLPSAVYIKPGTYRRVIASGNPFNYDFGFRNFEYIEGTEAWRDISESLRGAVGWEEVAGQPGVYEGYVETGFDNVMWREKLTIVITEADGTMKASDYVPVGTITVLPVNLKTIEAEAFFGTQLTEVDIPAGVSISEDAFSDTGLIAVYTHNDQNIIDWAVKNGVIALTD